MQRVTLASCGETPKTVDDQPPCAPRLEALGSERRRVPEAPEQVHSSPTLSQVLGAGQPLLTAPPDSSSPPAREPRDRSGGGDVGQEKAGEGGGDYSQRSAQGEEWSTSQAPEIRRGGEGRCVWWPEGSGGRVAAARRGGRRESYRRVSWRGGNPPHVAKVSSWTWRRTPEGPLQGREVAALEPGRLLSLSQGSRESPRLTAFSCCPPSALGEDLERDSHWDAPAAATIRKGVGENVSTRKGKDSLLCSCRATKPLPHSKEGRIPETAAPNSVEAGLTLPVDL
nr:PREDICTED: uncharacterized protein LOC103555060 [Equus przewalskii]